MGKNPFSNMSQTMLELLAGIFLFGLFLQIIFVWFAAKVWYFTSGLWLGVLVAVFQAIHMSYSIERSLGFTDSDAQGYMQKMVILRMGVIGLVFFIVCYFKLGNGVSMIAGMLTLKFSAYFQPLMHRLFQKNRKGR